MRRHGQVVLDGDVEALVARPADIERLTLDRARGHVDELLEHAQLDRVRKRVVHEHRSRDKRQREVARVDGKALADLMVKAWLATPELGLVGNIIVDEGGRVKMLDGRAGGARHLIITPDGPACEHADERTVALAGVVRELGKRPVEIAPHVRMSALSEKLGHVAIEARRLFV